jgi:hypothetical protein
MVLARGNVNGCTSFTPVMSSICRSVEVLNSPGYSERTVLVLLLNMHKHLPYQDIFKKPRTFPPCPRSRQGLGMFCQKALNGRPLSSEVWYPKYNECRRLDMLRRASRKCHESVSPITPCPLLARVKYQLVYLSYCSRPRGMYSRHVYGGLLIQVLFHA